MPTPKQAPLQASNKSIKVHNSVKIDAANPVPVDFGAPAFTAVGSYKYIPFFQPDDNLFRTLLELSLLAPTHASCINDKAFYALGQGLLVQEQDKLPKELQGHLNAKRQGINDILKAVFEAYFKQGNKFVEIARTKVGSKNYIRINLHNNLDCRLQDNQGQDPVAVVKSRIFRRNGIITKLDNPVTIPLWTDDVLSKQDTWAPDPNNPNVERTCLHIKNEVDGVDYYGLPSFFAGMHQMLLEYKIARFNLDNFDNNMFLAGILAIQGNLSDEESKKLLQNLKKMYTGDGKYNRILPLSSESGITDTKFLPFSEKHDGQFLELDKMVSEKIVGAHQWSRAIMDMKMDGGLGKGGDYLRTLFISKYKTVIKPVQDNIQKSFIEPLLLIMDEWLGTSLSELPIYIKPLIPVQFEGTLDVNSLLTVDEGREEIGKQPLPDKATGSKLIAVASGGATRFDTPKNPVQQ